MASSQRAASSPPCTRLGAPEWLASRRSTAVTVCASPSWWKGTCSPTGLVGSHTQQFDAKPKLLVRSRRILGLRGSGAGLAVAAGATPGEHVLEGEAGDPPRPGARLGELDQRPVGLPGVQEELLPVGVVEVDGGGGEPQLLHPAQRG